MNLQSVITVPSKNRTFVPMDYTIETWETLKPYFEYLLDYEIHNQESFDLFLQNIDELIAIIYEESAWRYIRMTCDTQNAEKLQRFQQFVQEIQPEIAPYADKLNRKTYESPFFAQLSERKPEFKNFCRGLKGEIELFRNENIPIISEIQMLSQQYQAAIGNQTVEYEGKELTLPQAAKLLESHDRTVREAIWHKVSDRRKADWASFDEILDKLIALRTQVAHNAGYTSYTDYRYAELKRFDYNREDCARFWDAVEKVAKPISLKFAAERKERLGIDSVKPWDVSTDIFGGEPLRPFETGKELVEKSVEVLKNVKPELGEMLALMADLGFLDVESRVGKAPGGYNYPLAESGVPFIFMNAAGAQNDVITMLHESGHAVHSFVTRNLANQSLKETPSEVAELASMAMELITLDAYSVFYPDENTCKRAQKEQIMRSMTLFSWVATVDAFQHWIYDNPTHTHSERAAMWKELYLRFHGDELDWTGNEDTRDRLWMKQLHIFELPFYYIEYAFAQIGAMGVWRNYTQNPTLALNQYLSALQLGYTCTTPEIYATAGISFDFSEKYLADLLGFAYQEYEKIKL